MWEEGSTTAHSIQSSVVSKCAGRHRGDELLSLDSVCFQRVLTRGHASSFSLTRLDSTSSRRGRNIVGHRAIIDDSGQSGGNITVCADYTDYTDYADSAQTIQTTLSHFWTARTTCWYQQPTWIVRRSQLCCRMGQCQLPSCSTGPKLVCFPPTMSSSVPSTLHSISQCHQRAVQGWIQHCRLYSPCHLAMEHIEFFFLFECYFFVSTCMTVFDRAYLFCSYNCNAGCRASASKVVLEKSEMFCTVFLHISGDCREISLHI